MESSSSELSDVTWEESATIFKYMSSRLTELDAGVVLADLVTLLVGEEHVGRETALGGVGVWIASALATMEVHMIVDSPFLRLPPALSALADLRLVAASLGMVMRLVSARTCQ